MPSNINLDYYFQAKTIDNNGQNCTDINVGLKNLFEPFNEEKPKMKSIQRVLVGEIEESYPDYIAFKSLLSTQDLWWWILLACRLDDSFEGIKSNYLYPIFELLNIEDIKMTSSYETKEKTEEEEGNTIGKVVELN